MIVELHNGYCVRLYRSPFRWDRWAGDRGLSREGSPGRWRRVRMYQWPFGVIHVCSSWGKVTE